jgi:hypothetical protein
VNRFNHVHLNVGWPGEEHNPLLFHLVKFEDTVAPTIPPDGIRVYDEAWRPQTMREQNRLRLGGRVRVVLDAWDQADDNTPGRRLAPFELGYQVLHGDGSPAPGFERRHPSLRFDRLGPDPDAPHQIYAAGSGIPLWGQGHAIPLHRDQPVRGVRPPRASGTRSACRRVTTSSAAGPPTSAAT